MPFYTLLCPDCGQDSEHIMGMNEERRLVKCPHCGHGLMRDGNRHYARDLPQIQGDTVAGGCNYVGWDEGLDCYITGKQHRKDEMARQNKVEYAPDPDLQPHRAEARKIIQSAPKGDAEAASAAAAELDAARKKRTQRAVDKAFDKIDQSGAFDNWE